MILVKVTSLLDIEATSVNSFCSYKVFDYINSWQSESVDKDNSNVNRKFVKDSSIRNYRNKNATRKFEQNVE